MTLIKSNRSLVTGNKGQVALFVALIFQVLFLFFAMIVNVGLVVHHKINLQNSVDMAAYYGAMKQAELLNSIGHMNYQMRQSWKLLAWRYRILGTGGDELRHPYNYESKGIRNEQESSNDAVANFSTPPFCITYPPFHDVSGKAVPPNENLCKKTLALDVGQSMIRLFTPPAVIAGFIGLAGATRSLTTALRSNAIDRCYAVGPLNYLTVGNFLLAYQLDQFARRKVIARISKSMSRSKGDFDDIDGKSVKAGAEETLKRNLTYANKEGAGFSFEMYNGLANAGCGNIPPDDDKEYAAPWLSEIRAFPTIYYLDQNCPGVGDTRNITAEPKNFEIVDPGNIKSRSNVLSIPSSYTKGRVDELGPQIEYVAKNLDLYNDTNRFILGYEKNPWCQAYVGAKASTKPKIPFAPGDLTLTAEAYAKPFGGRIGPWYFKKWGASDQESTGDMNSRVDKNLPMRVKDVSILQNDPNLFKSPLRIANYSKYIGDLIGLKSARAMAYYTKLLYSIRPNDRRSIAGGSSPTDAKLISTDDKALMLDDWFEIARPVQANTEKDILAWNTTDNREPAIRNLEVAALAPDQFDLAYYSIEPNFYDNYYKKMKDGIVNKLNVADFFRPDLGSRGGNRTLEGFSVKDQIKLVKDISPPVLDFQTKLTYAVLNPVHLLTSWSNKTLFAYDKIEGDFFGNCVAPTIDKRNYTDPQTNTTFLNPDESVPGECITGGRTGYSVKIVSKDFLFSPVKAGGPASGESVILNPPSDF